MPNRPSAALLILAVGLGACSNLPPERPPVPVSAVPSELGRLRIHVENANDLRAREAGESDATGYTLRVRGAFQSALERAGWVVVVSPGAPRDVGAWLHTDYQAGRSGVGGALVTSLTLTAPGGVVEQLSTVVAVDSHAEIDETAVVHLAETVGRSERVARYARRVVHDDLPCAPPRPLVARD
jgi:hypothetical protein